MTDTQPSTLTLLSRSVEQTIALGRELGAMLRQGDVVALSGMLGAGKTQLVRGIAEGIGADPRLVASPTYVLMHEYHGRIPLVHIDAYRLQGLSDLESLGWTEDLLTESATVVEWADRIAPELPDDCLHITLSHIGDLARQLTFEAGQAWGSRLNQLQQTTSASNPPTQTACPICRVSVADNAPNYPFCSERCRLVDLNRWFNEEYRLSRPIETDDDLDA